VTRPKRILVVYPYLHHYRYGVFRALQDHPDLDVSFVADDQGRAGIPAVPNGLLERHSVTKVRWFRRFSWQRGLRPYVQSADIDSVVFLGDVWSLSTWAASIWARRANKRVYFWTIGWHRPEGGLMARIRLRFYRQADHLLLYGSTGLELGSRAGYSPSKMTVIGNSHVSSHSRHEPRRGDLGALLPSGHATVGAVVRLTASKRLDLLIRAAAVLASRGRPVTVVLAGEGPERTPLEELARSLGVDAVFTGAVYHHDDLEEIYEHLQVTVVPAAAGLTVIQSLAHGVPVITDDDRYTQMPEADAVLDDVTGARYPSGDIDALAAAIDGWLVRTKRSPAEVADAARAEVLRAWTPDAQAERIAAVVTAR